MDRRYASRVLLASAAGSLLLAPNARAQSCTPPCFPTGPNETGVVDNTFPPGDVRRYGAKGDGINDDGPAIQNAINSAPANATVFLPPNAISQVYKINSGLKISRPIRFVGSGPLQTTLYANGFAAGSAVLEVDGTVNPNLEFVEVSNLTLMSSNNSPDLLKINRVANSAFRDIGLRNGSHGLLITGNRTFSNLFERVICIALPLYIATRFSNHTGGGQHTFVGCAFAGAYGIVVSGDSEVPGISLTSCNFEGTSNEAIYCNGTVQGLNLSGCRFEKCNSFADILIDPATGKSAFGIEIHGCHFETDAAHYAVQFGGAGGAVRGFHISGNYAQDYQDGFIRLNGDGESGVICGNRLQNVPSVPNPVSGVPNIIPAVVNAVRPGVLVVANENQSEKLFPTHAYAPSGFVASRSFHAATATATDLANVLGTLIADLQGTGLIR